MGALSTRRRHAGREKGNLVKHTSGPSDALLEALKDAGAVNFYDDIDSLDQQVTTLLDENMELQRQLGDANRENESLKNRIDELESTIERLTP